MKKMLVGLFSFFAIAIGIQQASFAACPCQTQTEPCPCAKPCNPCACNKTVCEDFLNCTSMEDYFCRIGLNECQKDQARKAIEEFKCARNGINANGKCESKCECRIYRRALKDLDCKMKNIITQCQKSDYKSVRHDVKDKVKCCHKCLINPFKRCKCACK